MGNDNINILSNFTQCYVKNGHRPFFTVCRVQSTEFRVQLMNHYTGLHRWCKLDTALRRYDAFDKHLVLYLCLVGQNLMSNFFRDFFNIFYLLKYR